MPTTAEAIALPDHASARVRFAAERLQAVVRDRMVILRRADAFDCPAVGKPTVKQGYTVAPLPDGTIAVVGFDDNGILYGALALRNLLAAGTHIIETRDAPAFVMRGTVIGMQKTSILPGRKVYEYPYTPDLFPFFYDEAFWTRYLDFLLEHRFDTLFLWNGCPFPSLVNVAGYEDTLEVSPDVFARNVEMFRHVTSECDKRGIWLVQNFYSILIPKPLAEKHGVPTQLKAPTDFASDYTRKAITQFVKEYPRVGLMPCLGEALEGIENQKYWLNEVCIAGIQDGMKLAGLTEEPPVVIRTHATDLRQILPSTFERYKNIYTEAKFNGESLTTYEPRGKRQAVHRSMSELGSRHLINVHVLANLEPFRYGAQRFIQKCVQGARDRLNAKGLHLYPLNYWAFPETPDRPPLDTITRDWAWYTAWARYAWNPDVDEKQDRAFWVAEIAKHYGNKAAPRILDAMNDIGECAPRILRRFGITEGNRQTMSLGMTLDELVNPAKYRPFEELWESQSPPGERLAEYVEREVHGKPHVGETPASINAEVRSYAQSAVKAIDAAAPHVTGDTAEFERLRSDIHAIALVSESYVEKVAAAVAVLHFNHTNNVADLESARPHLARSLELYKQLAELTAKTYRFANSMQTAMRRVPVIGAVDNQPANYHWTQLVPLYEQELADFDQQIVDARSGKFDANANVAPLTPAKVTVISGGEAFEVKPGALVYTDRDYTIQSLAGELKGLTAIRFPHTPAKDSRLPPIVFESAEPVTVLVGFMKDDRPFWRRVPDLETDAMAIDQYTSEPVLQNAATIDSLPGCDVYGVKFPAGRKSLDLRGSGSFVVLGIVPQSATLPKRDAKLGGNP